MKITCVEEMRAMDRAAVERFGISEELLMENASLAVCEVIRRRVGVEGKRFSVFCGMGNNGGDGFAIARKLHSDGAEVRVYLLGDPQKYKGAARANFEILGRTPVPIVRLESAEEARSATRHSDAVVDAIFGTGLARDVAGLHREVIEMIRASGRRVVSVDIPSGVNGDTGKVMGAAIRAECTVTFGLPKIGNVLHPGCELGGRLYVSHISFPPSIRENPDLKISLYRTRPLPPRNPEGHKGSFGQALFIAGAAGYFGAPYFSALSFLKAGGGYSRLATPEPVVAVVAAKCDEIVFVPQKATKSGSMALANQDELIELASKMDVVVLGPGLSLDPETQDLARILVREIDRPLLIDGDGITAVSADRGAMQSRTAPTILTPHMGEMSRLTGFSVSEIEADRVENLRRACRDLGATVVLKGARSLTGFSDGRVFVNPSGNSGMATAGSGDVLCGAIAAMIGLGLPPEEAAAKGVFLHGLAGDLAAQAKGEDGMTASDILDFLPHALRMDRQKLPPELQERYEVCEVV